MFGLEPYIFFMDCRIKSGNDRGEEKNTGMTGKNKSMAMILFFLARVRPQASKFVSVAGDFFVTFL